VTEAQSLILKLLADGQMHHLSQIHDIPLPYESLEEALDLLISEESVIDEDGYLSLKR